MPAHKYAALMLQYATDAQDHEEPWLLWQQQSIANPAGWRACDATSLWNTAFQYRRAPKTYKVGGLTFIEPERAAPAVGTAYWWPNIDPMFYNRTGSIIEGKVWENSGQDKLRLRAGIVHLSAENATAHSNALTLLTAS